jgi:bifunctional DNA-binding transcriptional regulator/antitoxin component of YhaV-PrlF toxin-antitoxin module
LPLLVHGSAMTDEDSATEIVFSKKVDRDGRMVVPQEHRQALNIDGREALVQFTAKKVAYLDEDEKDE